MFQKNFFQIRVSLCLRIRRFQVELHRLCNNRCPDVEAESKDVVEKRVESLDDIDTAPIK